MGGGKWWLALLWLGATGCAPFIWEARPSAHRLSASEQASLARLETERSRFDPSEGVVFALEGADTSTDSLADTPLESVWWGESGPVAPILAETGTPTFTLPQADHDSVRQWVKLLRGPGRGVMRTYLARSTRYVPLFYEVLDRHGLPRDLVFLAMVESGFSPRAYSWAGAAGPWQFMPVTGRRYGLRVGFWVDERRDFEKATEAAARHLVWLQSVFQDWHLAMAAYNAGAGGVRSALKKSGAEDFWSLQRSRRLRKETKQYVPKILASAIVAKQPALNGLSRVPYQPRITWDTVKVRFATSLATIGEACGGLPKEALRELNPALRVGVTPPGETWMVRVPTGLAGSCKDGLAALPTETRWSFRYHEAAMGEPVDAIARKFGTDQSAILRFHEVDDPERMSDYAEIAVPVPFRLASNIPVVPPPKRQRGGSYAPGEARLIRYRVRSGDSIWRIAQRFKVSMKKLRGWNGLWKTNALLIGQTLRIYVGKGAGRIVTRRSRDQIAEGVDPARRSPPRRPTGKEKEHQVREGESLWSISQRYGTTVERLRMLNRLRPGEILSIGQTLKVR